MMVAGEANQVDRLVARGMDEDAVGALVLVFRRT